MIMIMYASCSAGTGCALSLGWACKLMNTFWLKGEPNWLHQFLWWALLTPLLGRIPSVRWIPSSTTGVLPQSKSGSACWHFPNPCPGLSLSALGGTLRPLRMLRCSTLPSTTSLRPTWGAYCGKGFFRRRFACGHQFVDHFPLHPIGLGVDGLPPFRRAPCVVASCRRCSEFSGVVRFSWLGTWNSSAVLALPGSDTRFAWQSGYERLGEAQLDLLLIQPLRTQWTASDFVLTASMAWLPSPSTTVTAWPRRVMGCLEDIAA